MSVHSTAVKANKFLPRDRDISATRIINEAHDAGILVSDAFSLLEGEAGFHNIFGCDTGGMFCHERVTKTKANLLLEAVRKGHVSNGVGVSQLTSLGYLEQANAAGGLHLPHIQARIAFRALASLQRTHGRREGFRRYNGSGPAAERYARERIARAAVWHNRLS